MASAFVSKDPAVLILAELGDLRHEIRQLRADAAIGGEKQWLKPAEFSKLCGLAKRTLAAYANEGRFSARAVRQIKRGSSFMNEYHRRVALDELQNPKNITGR